MQSGSLPVTIPDGDGKALNSKDRDNKELLTEIINQLKMINTHYTEWDGDEYDSN